MGHPVVRVRVCCAVTATEDRLSASRDGAETFAVVLLSTEKFKELLEVASGDWDAAEAPSSAAMVTELRTQAPRKGTKGKRTEGAQSELQDRVVLRPNWVPEEHREP